MPFMLVVLFCISLFDTELKTREASSFSPPQTKAVVRWGYPLAVAASAALWSRCGERLQQSSSSREQRLSSSWQLLYTDTDAEDFTHVSRSKSVRKNIFKNHFFNVVSQDAPLISHLFPCTQRE